MMPQAISTMFFIYHEILLACACGIILLGVDDLIIFLIWLFRVPKKAIVVRFPASSVAKILPPIAIFVPAWDEGDVIGPMLTALLRRVDYPDYVVFVGCYPNDRATIDAIGTVAAIDSRIHTVTGLLHGPTTKSECLNRCWHAMREWEQREGREVAAIVLHEAEDLVHPEELRVIAGEIDQFDMVQLPVLPLIDRKSMWVGGHYADEFAVAHGVDLPTRQYLGAALPSSGVGCGISRRALVAIAKHHGGQPFDPNSLTEDYEFGLRLGELGYRACFMRCRSPTRGDMIAVRAYFPSQLHAAVRQKTRWNLGIAVLGWDRLGWHGSVFEHWMRLRDRRALLSAFILLLSYLSLVVAGLVIALQMAGMVDPPALPDAVEWAPALSAIFLWWRVMQRMGHVYAAYGWRQALISVPRSLVGNVIAMMAARRAFMSYLWHPRSTAMAWDKTSHVFPQDEEV